MVFFQADACKAFSCRYEGKDKKEVFLKIKARDKEKNF